jgi:hypothetical protein
VDQRSIKVRISGCNAEPFRRGMFPGRRTSFFFAGLCPAPFSGLENALTYLSIFSQLPNRSDTIEATVLGSAYHIELNPSENGIYDRVVVQDVIKDIAQSQPLEVSKDSRPFKVVILDEADLLTREAQQGLRRTMEKYMATCRISTNRLRN